jgi:hypothetical protein
VIILRVRWYLRFKLSLRDLVEMMAERGLSMAHTTIMRWMQRYAPEFDLGRIKNHCCWCPGEPVVTSLRCRSWHSAIPASADAADRGGVGDARR